MPPLTEQIKTKLEEAGKDQNSGERLRNEITVRLDWLQAIIENAEVEHAAARWAKLKPRRQAAWVQYLGTAAK